MSFIHETRDRLNLGQFSDDFDTQAPSYLLHLTRILDRTDDLYHLTPVWPIAQAVKDPPRRVKIVAASTKRRIQRQMDLEQQLEETEALWRDAQKTADETLPPRPPGKDVAKIFEAANIELGWRQANLSKYKLLEPGFGYDAARWRKEVLNVSKIAFERVKQETEPCHLLFFLPEFSFPPIQSQIQRSIFLNRFRKEYIKMFAKNVTSAQDFLFLGSFHDLARNFNLGVCFPFGLAPYHTSLWPTFQHQSNEGVYFQRKRHASKKLGEFLPAVETMEFPIFETTAGRVAVLICSDIYDPSLFLSLVRHNLRCLAGLEVKYILVPAYNKSRKLVETCRQLSYLMNNVVVYNTSHPDRFLAKKSGDAHCFICGRDAADLIAKTPADSAIQGLVSCGDYALNEMAAGHEQNRLIEFTIDLAKLDLLRLATRKRYPRSIIQGGRRITSID